MAAGVAVAIAVVTASIVAYVVVRGQILGQVDNALRNQAATVNQDPGSLFHSRGLPSLGPGAGGPTQYWQLVNSAGTPVDSNFNLPIDSGTRSVASAQSPHSFFENVSVQGSDLRVLTLPVVNNGQFAGALQLADSLVGADHTLSHLGLILFLLSIGGIALAAVLGRLAARRVLAPLGEVAQTASYISETDDLSHRLRVRADDEVGELATRFNAMLDRLEGSRSALDESMRAQRQLVADASHELRTPVTSLRTNIEVLLAGGKLSEEDRRRLLDDVVEQSEELSTLVSDLIDLARGDEPPAEVEDVRLDGVVEECLARARRNAPGLEFRARLAPVLVDGVPNRLERAVNNLLDNAARHSPAGGTVEVDVDADGVRVRDHGSGVAEADLPHVFDRFFRGANVRGQQGSGLGLAIVRQVTEQHGGSVSAANAPDGGAVFTVRLPTTSPDESLSDERPVAGARP
jgi:two-component system sensor histidine kinase MprB